MAVLQNKNLHVALEDGTEIVKGVDLSVKTGEFLATGPNGGRARAKTEGRGDVAPSASPARPSRAAASTGGRPIFSAASAERSADCTIASCMTARASFASASSLESSVATGFLVARGPFEDEASSSSHPSSLDVAIARMRASSFDRGGLSFSSQWPMRWCS